MLELLDVLFLWLHIVIILFNIFGWVWQKFRKIHLILALTTLFSWIILGLKYGLGYCFLTDWHWEVKYNLGEKNLPASFIKYFLDQYTPFHLSSNAVDLVTGISFTVAILISIYLNFIYKKKASSG